VRYLVHNFLQIHSLPEGSSVAVFGCGAIGLGVISTSSTVGASRIIAIDTNPEKEGWAMKMGATEFINPTTLPEGKRIQDYLVEITDGGLDFTFDATGNVKVMRAALEACHKGWGVSTVIGVAAAGEEISTRPYVIIIVDDLCSSSVFSRFQLVRPRDQSIWSFPYVA